MDSLENMFNVNAVACESDGIKKMCCPGPECLAFFLQISGVYRDEGLLTHIQEVYEHMCWVPSRSLTWLDVQSVIETLKGNLSADDNTPMGADAEVEAGDADLQEHILSLSTQIDLPTQEHGIEVNPTQDDHMEGAFTNLEATKDAHTPAASHGVVDAVSESQFESELSLEDAVASLSSDTIATISAQVAEAWNQHKRIMPDFIRVKLTETVPETFAQERFLAMATRYIVDQRAQDTAAGKKRSYPAVCNSTLSEKAGAAKVPRGSLASESLQHEDGSSSMTLAAAKVETKASIASGEAGAAKVPMGCVVSQSSQHEVSSASITFQPAKADAKASLASEKADAREMRRGSLASRSSHDAVIPTSMVSPPAKADTKANAVPVKLQVVKASEKIKGVQNVSVATPAKPAAPSPKKKPSTMMQMMSPGRHLKQDAAQGMEVSGALAPLTSLAILGHAATKSIRWSYTGFIVYRGDIRRNSDSQKEGSWKQLCDFIVADSDAPLCMTLRDDELEKFMAALDAKSEDSNLVYFKVENFRILHTETTKWNGTVMTKMNRIQAINTTSTIPGTSLRLMSEDEAKMSAGSGLELIADICISDWDMLPKPIAVPSRLTLAGIVETKEDITTTTPMDGMPKQKCKFTLIDSKGRWLVCSAVGFNAQAPVLKVGNQVVLWFATVLKAWGSEPARCAVLNDGVIAPASDEQAVIPGRTAQMMLQE